MVGNSEESGFVEVDGADVYYEVAGHHSPHLVLINADKLDLRMWDWQVPELSQHFRVVRYDQVGIGRTRSEGGQSPPPRDPRDNEDYLRGLGGAAERQGPPTNHGDLLALLDSLGAGRSHLLGLGLGAITAIDFTLNHQDRVGSLLLVSAPHVWGNEEAIEARSSGSSGEEFPPGLEGLSRAMPLARDMLRRRDATPLIDGMLQDPTYAPSEEAARRRLRELLTDNGDAIMARRGRRYVPDFSTAEKLRQIESSTLVTYPAEDDSSVRETARLLAKDIPGARMVPLPGASRFVNLEDAKRFNEMVSEFLRAAPMTG